jgi:hypothetical protein
VAAKQRRERVAGQWCEKDVNSQWYWASTLSKNQLPSRILWESGHNRWDIENDCFNTPSTHWALDHCFKHDPTAIINFILTLLLVYVLLQCFWRRNLKPAARLHWSTLIALADELHRSLRQSCRAPWVQILPQPPGCSTVDPAAESAGDADTAGEIPASATKNPAQHAYRKCPPTNSPTLCPWKPHSRRDFRHRQGRKKATLRNCCH